ncbi:MAG: stage II sporulation protein M [Betaproteobacteria bacterium]|nr:stage II sporulation protein M [Betaproteobacteria bacterium]
MNQQEFTRRFEKDWLGLEARLDELDQVKRSAARTSADFPRLYRQVCQHLALARDRDYGAHLIERLNGLVLRGHQHLYEARAGVGVRTVQFFAADFPALIRHESRLFWISALLFFGSGLTMMAAVQAFPEMAYTVLDPRQAAQMEEMYRPDASVLGRERPADSDFLMFGFYIYNNVGIAFQTFASGLLAGIGTLFFLLFNGVLIGAVAGHLTNAGFGPTFYPFVIGHGAFELIAVVLAGQAGLKLGFALLAPGRLTRGESVRQAARVCVRIVYGIGAMLVIAAFLEAFWSSSTVVPAAVKIGVGAVLWALVGFYFIAVGRSHGS